MDNSEENKDISDENNLSIKASTITNNDDTDDKNSNNNKPTTPSPYPDTITKEIISNEIQEETNIYDNQIPEIPIVQLEEKFQNLHKLFIELQKENAELKAATSETLNHTTDGRNNDQSVQEKCKLMEAKMKLYKTKLVEFSSQLKQLKKCKEILLATVNEYTTAVMKWQAEILVVSNDFFEKNRSLKLENQELNEKLKELQILTQKKDDSVLEPMVFIDNVELSSTNQLTENHQTIIDDLKEKLQLKNTENDNLLEKIKHLEANSILVDVGGISGDNFEDKYNKLRAMAIKLKKKVSEQAAQIETFETEANTSKSKTTTTTTDNKSTTTSKFGGKEVQIRNLQLLQSENDKLQDLLEALQADQKNKSIEVDRLKEIIEKLSIELEEVKSSNSSIKSTADETQKRQTNQDESIKKFQRQIQQLKDEIRAYEIYKNDSNNEFQKLKTEISNKNDQIQREKDETKKFENELQKLKSNTKMSSVLNLEMEAYEKSLQETVLKLEAKNQQIVQIQITQKTLESTVESLQNQNKILTDNLSGEKQHSIELRTQIDQQQFKLKDFKHENGKLNEKINEIMEEKNATNFELEQLKLNLVDICTEKDKQIDNLKIDMVKNLEKLCNLETDHELCVTKLKETEREILDNKTEFVNYKVRAQSMLRQNHQAQERTREQQDLEVELQTLTNRMEITSTKLQTTLEQNRNLQLIVDELNQDKKHLQTRYNEVLQILEECRTNVDQLQEDNRKQNQEYQTTLKSHRLQMENLTNCYQKQIADLTERQQKELDDAINEKKKLQQIEQLNNVAATMMGAKKDNNNKYLDHQMMATSLDQQKIDWLLMERQDAEGSESNVGGSVIGNYGHQRKISSSFRNRRDLIPLDELLNSQLGLDEMENNISVDGNISPSFDLQVTKDKLLIQESRVKHLTTLLAEAEQDAAKLIQMNDVLKEEMRRQERSAEREKELNNLEYIKNVIFKFLTIQNGDEKSHLVPVINTILKLSPEETRKLLSVAKGGGDGTQRGGWGRFLPV